jgi:hypothetical protein
VLDPNVQLLAATERNAERIGLSSLARSQRGFQGGQACGILGSRCRSLAGDDPVKGQDPHHDTLYLAFDAGIVLGSESIQAVCSQHDVDPRESFPTEGRWLHPESRNPEPSGVFGRQLDLIGIEPTMRNFTPRFRRAPNNARSAGVSAKSSTAQPSSEALLGCQFQTAQGVVHIARVHGRVRVGHLLSALPQGFRMSSPRPLLGSQEVEVL